MNMMFLIGASLLFIVSVHGCEHGIPLGECFEEHQNWNLLPHGNCGERFYDAPIATRTTGGELSEYGEFPWLVNIYSHEQSTNPMLGCVGSIISTRYVLTTHMCGTESSTQWNQGFNINKENPSLWVRIGEFYVGEGAPLHPVNNIKVESVVKKLVHMIPPQPDKENIALLRLTTAITFTQFVQPICLPTHRSLLDMNLEGMQLQTAGWQVNASQPWVVYGRLRKVTLPVGNCMQRLPGNDYQPYFLCTGGYIKGIYRNADKEHGAGLVKALSLQFGTAKRYYIFGLYAGTLNNDTLFTKVTNQIKWILDSLII